MSYIFYGHQALADGGNHKQSHKGLENVPRNEYEQANLYGRKKGSWFMNDEIQIEIEVGDTKYVYGNLA